MKNPENHLETLSEIRSLMERSSRFISLSGLSGMFAGVFALIGAFIVYWKFNFNLNIVGAYENPEEYASRESLDIPVFLVTVATIVLVASLTVGVLLTTRQARRKNLPVWDASAKRVFWNLLIPLAAGGIFCLIMLKHGMVGLLAPATLLFYGLALLNASKYTYSDLRQLALCELVLGLLASWFIGYGLLFWAIGFGILHIIYGILLYNKYER
jgi:general stress protein CsbA